MRTFLLPLTFLFVFNPASAQDVPDLMLRDAMNSWVDGLVDADGYITQPGLHIPSIHIYTMDIQDLTGLEWLSCNSLTIDGLPDQPISAFPGFPYFSQAPPGEGHITLTYYSGAALPPIPPQIVGLSVISPGAMGPWSVEGGDYRRHF